MSRAEMVHGGGHHGGRNYDELMEMAGEPQHHGHHGHQGHNGHPAHASHPSHGAHHGHPGGGGHMVPATPVYVPSPYVQPAHQGHHGHHQPPPMYAEPARAAHQEHAPSPMRRAIVEHEPTRERLFPIGFVALGIAAGDEVDIEVKPQVYFRGERLAIPQSIARYFDIIDIKIGKDSQLAATGAMPGESFSTVAVGVRMELATAKPGIVITVRVRNVDTGDQDFKAVMYGCVLE